MPKKVDEAHPFIEFEPMLHTEYNNSLKKNVTVVNGYKPKLQGLNADVLFTGDLNTLNDFYSKNEQKMTEDEKEYMKARIKSSEAVNALKMKAYSDIAEGKQPVGPEPKTENGFVGFPEIKNNGVQTSGNGCWSMAYSLLLKSRGVELSQENIRGWRPDQTKNTKITDAMTDKVKNAAIFRMNTDGTNTISQNPDLLTQVLPNTSMRTLKLEPVITEGFTVDGQPASEADAATIKSNYEVQAAQMLINSVYRAINEDHSPVAITYHGHTMTITGISVDGQRIRVEDTTQSDPNQRTRYMDINSVVKDAMNPRQLDNGTIHEPTGFELDWLHDLKVPEYEKKNEQQPDIGSYEKDFVNLGQNGTIKVDVPLQGTSASASGNQSAGQIEGQGLEIPVAMDMNELSAALGGKKVEGVITSKYQMGHVETYFPNQIYYGKDPLLQNFRQSNLQNPTQSNIETNIQNPTQNSTTADLNTTQNIVNSILAQKQNSSTQINNSGETMRILNNAFSQQNNQNTATQQQMSNPQTNNTTPLQMPNPQTNNTTPQQMSNLQTNQLNQMNMNQQNMAFQSNMNMQNQMNNAFQSNMNMQNQMNNAFQSNMNNANQQMNSTAQTMNQQPVQNTTQQVPTQQSQTINQQNQTTTQQSQTTTQQSQTTTQQSQTTTQQSQTTTQQSQTANQQNQTTTQQSQTQNQPHQYDPNFISAIVNLRNKAREIQGKQLTKNSNEAHLKPELDKLISEIKKDPYVEGAFIASDPNWENNTSIGFKVDPIQFCNNLTNNIENGLGIQNQIRQEQLRSENIGISIEAQIKTRWDYMTNNIDVQGRLSAPARKHFLAEIVALSEISAQKKKRGITEPKATEADVTNLAKKIEKDPAFNKLISGGNDIELIRNHNTKDMLKGLVRSYKEVEYMKKKYDISKKKVLIQNRCRHIVNKLDATLTGTYDSFGVLKRGSNTVRYSNAVEAIRDIANTENPTAQNVKDAIDTVKLYLKDKMTKRTRDFGQDRWNLFMTFLKETMPRNEFEAYCAEINAARKVSNKPESDKYVSPEMFGYNREPLSSMFYETRDRLRSGKGTDRDYATVIVLRNMYKVQGNVMNFNRRLTDEDRKRISVTVEKTLESPEFKQFMTKVPVETRKNALNGTCDELVNYKKHLKALNIGTAVNNNTANTSSSVSHNNTNNRRPQPTI